jgi:enoyl-CoA hydratase/carnithine racemase
MASELRTERRGSTLLLTISDPPTRNALSEQVYTAGVEALNVAEADAALRCVVLQGDGGHFTSGGDLRRLASRRAEGAEGVQRGVDRMHALVESLRAFPKPVIAAVEGAAAGAGFSLALACDLIVAAEDARFTMAYGRIGLTPDGGGLWHLMQALPRQRVTRCVWFAEPLTARELLVAGVVGWVTDNGGALAQAFALADRLTQTTAPNAVAGAKELIELAPRRAFGEHLTAERRYFVDNLLHPNANEGLAAFLEKRSPRFE